jgi:hypothetical protein
MRRDSGGYSGVYGSIERNTMSLGVKWSSFVVSCSPIGFPAHSMIAFRTEMLPLEGLIDYVVKLEISRTIPFPGAYVSVVLKLKLPPPPPYLQLPIIVSCSEKLLV